MSFLTSHLNLKQLKNWFSPTKYVLGMMSMAMAQLNLPKWSGWENNQFLLLLFIVINIVKVVGAVYEMLGTEAGTTGKAQVDDDCMVDNDGDFEDVKEGDSQWW